MNKVAIGSPEPNMAKHAIRDAALRCFERYGPQRTSMADIAEEAGISRKTLYRTFEDRSTLVEYILNERLSALGKKIRKKIWSYASIETALVEGALLSIAAGRADELFQQIVKKDTNLQLDQFLFRGSEQVRADMAETWFPVLDKARAEGRVREDLSDARIVELIISVYAIMFMRDDYGKAEQRAFLKDFLLPAILCPS